MATIFCASQPAELSQIPIPYPAELFFSTCECIPLVAPYLQTTMDNVANLIELSASRLIESIRFSKDDYVGECGLSNGSGPIEIQASPRIPWNRRTKLHSNVSSLFRIGVEALITVTRLLRLLGAMSRPWSWKSACSSHHRRENSPKALHKKILGKYDNQSSGTLIERAPYPNS